MKMQVVGVEQQTCWDFWLSVSSQASCLLLLLLPLHWVMMLPCLF